MQEDFIKEIISSIIGKIGDKLVDILYKKKNVNEFIIAKKLNLTINQTRNILYKLSDRDLVHFIRKKDSKKGGWYTYFWTLNDKKSLELLKEELSKKIENLESELQKRKSERFYYGPSSGLEYNEEEALENNFICPETGEVLQLKNNKELADKIDIEISKLKLLMEDVNEDLGEVEKKRQKDKERKLKVEAKKKEAERKARRAKLKRQRAKEKKQKNEIKDKTKRKKEDKKIKRKKVKKKAKISSINLKKSKVILKNIQKSKKDRTKVKKKIKKKRL